MLMGLVANLLDKDGDMGCKGAVRGLLRVQKAMRRWTALKRNFTGSCILTRAINLNSDCKLVDSSPIFDPDSNRTFDFP